MTTNPRHRDKGSVILIAVGILVMVAMVGMTFVLAAYMDRRVSTSIVRSVPFKKAALGTLTLAQQKLIEDLRFNQTGNSDRPYEAATTWMQQVDGPFKTVDPWLASTVDEAKGPAGNKVFSRISDLFGEGTPNYDDIPPVPMPNLNTPIPVAGKTGWYVDTDGDGTVDARLVDTAVRDAQGNRFYVGVRIIDTCSQINVNTAYGPKPVVPFDEPYASGGTHGIPVTDMDWLGLQPPAGASRDDIHKKRSWLADPVPSIWAYWLFYARCAANQNAPAAVAPPHLYYPVFGLDDQLALSWRGGQATKNTYTGRGRLASLLRGEPPDNVNLFKLRPFLTTWNSSRVIPPRIPTIMAAGGVSLYDFPQGKRADLNPKLGTPAERAAAFFSLYMAAANSIPLGVPGLTDGPAATAATNRRRRAAQMAVNIIDFGDADEDVTVMDVLGPGLKVYGIERQPFLTEAFHKVYRDGGGVLRRYSAIELFNPYETAIHLKGLKLTQGVTEKIPVGGWPAALSIPARSRMVIISSTGVASAIPVHADTPAARVIKIDSLDISQGIKIYRSQKYDGTGEKDVLLVAVSLAVAADPVAGASECIVRQWDDRLDKARYTLGAKVKDFTDRDYTNENTPTPMLVGNTNLGKANDKADQVPAGGQNTPVYVRNGKFVSLGDLARIFHVGPGYNSTCLAGNLGDGASPAQGRLDATVSAVSADPNKSPPISPACLASEFFTVINPAADGIDNDGDWLGGTIFSTFRADPEEDVVFGMLNVNSAPREALLCLPYVTPAIADQIIADRNIKPLARPAFAASGELLATIRNPILGAGKNLYAPAGANFKIADGKTTDDGLAKDSAANVSNDLTKLQAVYTRMANMITVRSDSFAVYITVMRFGATGDLSRPSGVRRYVALLDRSDCYKRGHWPKIKMFVEIR